MEAEMTFAEMAQKLAEIEEMLTVLTIRMGKPDMAAHRGIWEAVATAEGKHATPNEWYIWNH